VDLIESYSNRQDLADSLVSVVPQLRKAQVGVTFHPKIVVLPLLVTAMAFTLGAGGAEGTGGVPGDEAGATGMASAGLGRLPAAAGVAGKGDCRTIVMIMRSWHACSCISIA
jgi:hypothetical protein